MQFNTRYLFNNVATFFNVGKIPFAPGTFGSLAGIAYYLIFSLLYIYFSGVNFSTSCFLNTNLNNFILLNTLTLTLLGIKSCSIYISDNINQDPKEVVIDEVVGQLLTICLNIIFIHIFLLKYIVTIDSYFLTALLSISFISFRLFDIIKPWPISFFDENIKGGLGIMLDDIAAAILASIFCAAISSIYYIYIL